jgi:hypothetical protein
MTCTPTVNLKTGNVKHFSGIKSMSLYTMFEGYINEKGLEYQNILHKKYLRNFEIVETDMKVKKM